MIDLTFLRALRDKLKGGNIRSIHLNALPGRYATRLDFASLDNIKSGLARTFLDTLLTKANFEFEITFDKIDLNAISGEDQKRLGLISKRLNSLCYENDDNFKEHGIKTFGFGYPIIIKPSRQDPKKIIKAPLFIWPLEILKSRNKANTWSILRNKTQNVIGKIIDSEIHSINLNDVLIAYLKADENISIPQINEELLEDAIIDRKELMDECFSFLQAFNGELNSNLKENLYNKFLEIPTIIPDAPALESVTNNSPWIYFGGVFGLYRTQKESIITDIDKIIDQFDDFKFDELEMEGFTGTAYSAVETDPSQQEILSTLGLNQKKIIQGPPGTGKSQSLTALITNALANNLKCLVVCEKKTALDVIKNNLYRENELLGDLTALVEDINKDRDGIVNSVRDKINTIKQHYFNQLNYQVNIQKIENLVDKINIEHRELDKKIYLGKSWSELVGEYLKLEKSNEYKVLNTLLEYKDFSFHNDENELLIISDNLKVGRRLFQQVNTSEHPLSILNDEVFSDTNVSAIQFRLEQLSKTSTERLNILKNILSKNTQIYNDWLNKYYVELGDSCANIVAELTNNLSEYKVWLNNHYSNHILFLNQQIDKYLSFNKENYGLFGELFYSNTSFTKFKIKLLSIFSSKYKSLIINRKLLITEIEAIKKIQEQYNYINHTFVQNITTNSLRPYIDNINELKTTGELWHNTIDQIVIEHLDGFNLNNKHPEYTIDLAPIEVTENTYRQKVTSLNRDKAFNIDVLPDASHRQKILIIEKILNRLEEIFDIQEYYTDILSYGTLHYHCDELRLTIQQTEQSYDSIISYIKNENLLNWNFSNQEYFHNKVEEIDALVSNLNIILNNLNEFRGYYNWKNFFDKLPFLHKQVILALIESDLQDWEEAFTCWYYHWLLSKSENNNLPINDDKLRELMQLKSDLRNFQIKSIVNNWSGKQYASIRNALGLGINPSTLFNKKGGKGEKRNSLRKIIDTDFGLFTDFFPVLMVSPSVCSSIVPLNEGLFDIVIFDEASQLRIEDTFPALFRGKIKIVSGDSQQMPPSSYFQGGGALLNPSDEEQDENSQFEEVESTNRKLNNSLELAESESLLVYAENSNYTPSYLKVHYRSNHPHLIDFSNYAFYGKRLIPMPERSQYKPIKLIEVNGLYEDQSNRDEARQVVDILLNHIKLNNGKYPSVGIATFNLYQRNLILEEISRIRQKDLEFDKKISALEPDFFVKNLENIQGDERDIIIISTTFGRKRDGSFGQHFGPIIQKNGYKLLNVIVTRAKIKIYVCTSIPIEYIKQYSVLLQQYRNNGRAIFYTYLAYAKAVSEGDETTRQAILQQLYDNCESKIFEIENDSTGSESPFEDEVYYRLAEKIGQNRIEQQHKVGGFRIDIVIKSKNSGLPVLAIECDGAKYHSSHEAYAWDMFRQTQIETHGFKFYRIWSTNWWISPEKELRKLVEYIHQYDHEESQSIIISPFIADDEEITVVTKTQETKKIVTMDSKVTIKGADGHITQIKFSKTQNLIGIRKGENGLTYIYEKSPLAINLINKLEGEICQLGMLEVYYEIVKID